MALSELQFAIIDAMMDDCEDLEQVYLAINRDVLRTNGQPNYLLRIVADELLVLVDKGLIQPRSSWNEDLAPVAKLNPAAIYCYWFFPTEKGKVEWKTHSV